MKAAKYDRGGRRLYLVDVALDVAVAPEREWVCGE